MPRTARQLRRGYCYHVLNRGNAKAAIFHDGLDYQAFIKLLAGVRPRYETRLLAFCLMPNHFHLVLQGDEGGAVSRAMQWVQTAYVTRYRTRYETTGHILQGRFKSFPIQKDDHLLTVMRYVERNPVRSNLVARASAWPWSSARWRQHSVDWLDDSPTPLGNDWLTYVDKPQTPAETAAIRVSLARGAPFGSSKWRRDAAKALGLSTTLRKRGRPRKAD
jgi:putative transposase